MFYRSTSLSHLAHAARVVFVTEESTKTMVDDLNRLDFLVPFPEQLTNSVYDVTPHSDEEWTKVSKERMELNICRVDMDSVQDEADWVCA